MAQRGKGLTLQSLTPIPLSKIQDKYFSLPVSRLYARLFVISHTSIFAIHKFSNFNLNDVFKLFLENQAKVEMRKKYFEKIINTLLP